MTNPPLTPMTLIDSFGYNHSTPILSKKTKRFDTIRYLLGFGLFFVLAWWLFDKIELGIIIVGIIFLWVYFKFTGRKIARTTKELLIFTRYVIVGDSIVHYQNLLAMDINDREGYIVLTLKSPANAQPHQVAIMRTNFKCVTKKTDKIKLRQQEKFSKVCQDLRQLVPLANPQVRITFA